MDYKELIEELRFLSGRVPEQMCDGDGKDPLERDAGTIETLPAERDEAVKALRKFGCNEGSITWSVMEGDREDLTVSQIAEVLDVSPQTIHESVRRIRVKTGYVVPHKVRGA